MENLGNPYILYWQGQIEEDLNEIKELNRENKDFQGIREKHTDIEIQMMIREILFLNARCIQLLKARIDDAKGTVSDLRRRGPGSIC